MSAASHPRDVFDRIDDLVADCVTVFQWNPHLYRHVLTSGLVLGFLIGVCASGSAAFITWAVLRG